MEARTEETGFWATAPAAKMEAARMEKRILMICSGLIWVMKCLFDVRSAIECGSESEW